MLRTIKMKEKIDIDAENARIKRALTQARRKGPFKDEETGAWTLVKRTAREEQCLAKAKEKAKNNKTTKQIVLGRTFQGTAFLPAPAQIVFADFEVGTEEIRKVTLTNVSWTFNTFKLLDFNIEISDFFEVFYTRPGEMSAGMSCELTVKFTPKVNEDIYDEIRFLAKTGPFSIPLIATTKKVEVSVTPEPIEGVGRLVSFDHVVLAEHATRTITISNAGALATRLDVLGNFRDVGPITTQPEKLEDLYLPAHGSQTIHVTFSPTAVGKVKGHAVLHFHTHEVDDVVINFEAAGTDVPVYVHKDSEVIDFDCCVIDSLYRDELVLCNRGKTSMKVTPTVPQFLRAYLDYVPKFGFIQSGESLSYQLKLRPSRSLLKALEDGVLSTDINIDVNGQALQIAYRLQARLTTADLTLSSTALNFGRCTIGEGASKDLTVTNTSLLPLEIGFVGLPKGIQATPNQGFACLQPRKSKTFTIAYTPGQAVLDDTIKLMTERNDVYKIKVGATAVKAPLQLSESILKLPATALNDVSRTTIVLKNNSSSAQVYEFAVPEDAGLVVSPGCGTIAAGGQEPVLVAFEPTAASVPLDAWDAHDQPHHSWQHTTRITCYIKGSEQKGVFLEAQTCVVLPTLVAEPLKIERPPTADAAAKKDDKPGKGPAKPAAKKGAPAAAAEDGDGAEQAEEKESSKVPRAPSLQKAEDFIAWHNEYALSTVHFGTVPAHNSVTKTILVRSLAAIGDAAAFLSAKPLDPFGAFILAKPPTPVLGGQVCEVSITFTPTAASTYIEEFVIESPTSNNLVLTLRGTGLAPALTLKCNADGGGSSDNMPDGYVPIPLGAGVASSVLAANGITVVPEARKCDLVLSSSCNFRVPFHITFVTEAIEPVNHNGAVPFAVIPDCGVVPPGQSVTIQALFSPDHAFEYYRATAICKYGGEETHIPLKFTGSGWGRGLYVRCPGALPLNTRIDRDGDKVIRYADIMDNSLVSLDIAEAGVKSVKRFQYDFVPVFSRDRKLLEDAKHTILVGNVKTVDPKATANGEITIEPKEIAEAESLGFKISGFAGGKLALASGATDQAVEITFSPKDATGHLAPEVFARLPVPGVSLDVECVLNLCVKGGFPQAEPEEVSLLLKGSIKIPTS
eukprot:TRINITY_DN2070_c0_g1_i1.p1 TRINITY_DN2070_c0_g1~~TRINITY_DN2070_c0_g1_i1.p1  ORF type:complete len:1151 (+),score=450.30 TRINITY_DN2070_c0_g1_i1:54-3455(+)